MLIFSGVVSICRLKKKEIRTDSTLDRESLVMNTPVACKAGGSLQRSGHSGQDRRPDKGCCGVASCRNADTTEKLAIRNANLFVSFQFFPDENDE